MSRDPRRCPPSLLPFVRSKSLKSAPQDARVPTEASAARALSELCLGGRPADRRSPDDRRLPLRVAKGAASGSPCTVSAQIVLFAAPGRDDRRPRIPGGAAAGSFVGGVLALRSESVRACAALAVRWRRERPPEPGLSGGWTWADSRPVVTTGAEIQTAACPGATVALADGDRTLSQLALDSLRTARCLQFLAGTLARCPRTTYRRRWAGVNR